jgi:hypothetical protein
MNESLNNKAVSTLAVFISVKQRMNGVNDYGEATGFCAENDQLVQDFDAALGSLRARASQLNGRLKRHSEAKAAPTK